MAREQRSLSPNLRPESFQQQVSALIDNPVALLKVTELGAESANTRAITLQVVDRLGNPWAGRWLIYVQTSQASDLTDAPAACTAFSLPIGVGKVDHVANASFTCLTLEDGSAQIKIEDSSTIVRAVGGFVIGRVEILRRDVAFA